MCSEVSTPPQKHPPSPPPSPSLDVQFSVNFTQKKWVCYLFEKLLGRVLLDFLGSFFGCPNWYTGSKRSQDAALTLNGITITNMKTKNPTETFSILKKKNTKNNTNTGTDNFFSWIRKVYNKSLHLYWLRSC